MKKTLMVALVLGLACFLTSCIIAVVDYSGTGAFSRGEEFHKIVAFDPGGTVSLENESGTIEIQGWDNNEVEVTAEEDQARPYDRSVRVYGIGNYPRLKVEFDRYEDFIKIKTPLRGRDEVQRVNYFLNVPHSVNLREISNRTGNITISDVFGKAVVDLKEGDVFVENFSGSLRVTIDYGSAKAELLDLRNGDEVRISTRQGDITLLLQEGVNAMIEASTPNGKISSELDLGQTLPAEKVSAQLGERGAAITLSSLSGNINIVKIK